MYNLVDSHCHLDLLDLSPYEGNLQALLQAANAVGVQYFLTVGVDLNTVAQSIAIAEQFPNVFASVGQHPNETQGEEPTLSQLLHYLQHPKVVAVGETGLDYYRSQGDLSWQRERFKMHIQAAKQMQLPLIIHTREACQDTLTLMRTEKADLVGGVMHCFTESWDAAMQALDLGFYISISGVVTFKKAEHIIEVATKVPLDRLLIETDSPYLAPVPMRGKSNEPQYVRFVAEFIAKQRGISLEALAEATTQNFFTLFARAGV